MKFRIMWNNLEEKFKFVPFIFKKSMIPLQSK